MIERSFAICLCSFLSGIVDNFEETRVGSVWLGAKQPTLLSATVDLPATHELFLHNLFTINNLMLETLFLMSKSFIAN